MEDHQNPAGRGDLPQLPLPPIAAALVDAGFDDPALITKLTDAIRRNDATPMTPEERLNKQAALMHFIFLAMAGGCPGKGRYGDLFNIDIALRAQRYSAKALRALRKVEISEAGKRRKNKKT